MKIFISGARDIKTLDKFTEEKLLSISDKGYEVLIGDCYGVDASVQRFYNRIGYRRVTVYASGTQVRNNIGNFATRSVLVPNNMNGFAFYAEKDRAMAREADLGFMIWNGESRGTFANIVNLVEFGKRCCVYIVPQERMASVRTPDDLCAISMFSAVSKRLYEKFVVDSVEQLQLS